MILQIILPILPKCSTHQLNPTGKPWHPKFDTNELLNVFHLGNTGCVVLKVVLLRLILSFFSSGSSHVKMFLRVRIPAKKQNKTK